MGWNGGGGDGGGGGGGTDIVLRYLCYQKNTTHLDAGTVVSGENLGLIVLRLTHLIRPALISPRCNHSCSTPTGNTCK